MAWVNFNQIQSDLVNLLKNSVSSAKLVKKEADERDYGFHNMPLIDVRLKESQPEVRAGRDYYVFVTFEVQVTANDLSGYDEAATLRDSVLSDAMDAVRNNASFSASLETSTVSLTEFSNAKDDDTGAFMAAATFQVIAEAFIDRS
jgi:hypothetical protein